MRLSELWWSLIMMYQINGYIISRLSEIHHQPAAQRRSRGENEAVHFRQNRLMISAMEKGSSVRGGSYKIGALHPPCKMRVDETPRETVNSPTPPRSTTRTRC